MRTELELEAQVLSLQEEVAASKKEASSAIKWEQDEVERRILEAKTTGKSEIDRVQEFHASSFQQIQEGHRLHVEEVEGEISRLKALHASEFLQQQETHCLELESVQAELASRGQELQEREEEHQGKTHEIGVAHQAALHQAEESHLRNVQALVKGQQKAIATLQESHGEALSALGSELEREREAVLALQGVVGEREASIECRESSLRVIKIFMRHSYSHMQREHIVHAVSRWKEGRRAGFLAAKSACVVLSQRHAEASHAERLADLTQQLEALRGEASLLRDEVATPLELELEEQQEALRLVRLDRRLCVTAGLGREVFLHLERQTETIKSSQTHREEIKELQLLYQGEISKLRESHAAEVKDRRGRESELADALRLGEEGKAGLALTMMETEEQLAVAYSEIERQSAVDQAARLGLHVQVECLREALVTARREHDDRLHREVERAETATREAICSELGHRHGMELEDARACHREALEGMREEWEERVEKEKTLVEFSSRVVQESERRLTHTPTPTPTLTTPHPHPKSQPLIPDPSASRTVITHCSGLPPRRDRITRRESVGSTTTCLTSEIALLGPGLLDLSRGRQGAWPGVARGDCSDGMPPHGTGGGMSGAQGRGSTWG